MKKTLYLLGLVAVTFAACDDSKDASSTKVEMTNEIDSVSYFLGVSIGKDLKQSGATGLNYELIKKGLEITAVSDSVPVDPTMAQFYIMNYFDKMEKANNDKAQTELENWIKQNRDFAQIVKANEGYYYRVITEGTGAKPTIQDVVKVHYKGTLLNGTVFDSSLDGEPVEFPLSRVIKGWTLGLQNMTVGSTYELFIPAFLGYGASTGPSGTLPANSALVFEVQLLDIVPQN